MITEVYVSFEIAKLLKEKGFNIPCRFNYRSMYPNSPKPFYHKSLKDFNGEEYEGLRSEWFSAPTIQMTMKWLREVHNLHITIKPYITEEGIMYLFEIYKLERDKFTLLKSKTGFEKPELAENFAIKYCLENLI